MDINKEFNLVQRHKNFNKAIFEKLNLQKESEILSVSTEESRQVYNWNKQVLSCFHRSRCFARLNINKHGILYTEIEPEHYVEDLVAKWFLSRFPIFINIVSSSRGTFIAEKDKKLIVNKDKLETVLQNLESTIPENNLLSGLENLNDDDIWQTYYDSQNIKERKNRKLFLKNIPKKFHSWQGLEIEKKHLLVNHSLNEF